MIEKGGLRVVETSECAVDDHIYYVWTEPEKA